MSDGWDEIQALKSKRNSLRERLEKRKKERQDILGTTGPRTSSVGSPGQSGSDDKKSLVPVIKIDVDADPEVEKSLLHILSDSSLILPVNSQQLSQKISKITSSTSVTVSLHYYLQKLASQNAISVKDVSIETEMGYEVIQVDHQTVLRLYQDLAGESEIVCKLTEDGGKRKWSEDEDTRAEKIVKTPSGSEKRTSSRDSTDLMSLLSMPSTREKQNKQVGEEILELLSKPTAKERSLAEKFKSHGGAQVMEFCPHGTRAECVRAHAAEDEDSSSREEGSSKECNKLHFKKIIQAHTDESLGDCSFLNTCFHMDSCKYVHYEVDALDAVRPDAEPGRPMGIAKRTIDPAATMYPPQWIQCDLRYLDMTVLGKFAVIMADPPWDIHMELPYGTMSDDEMRQLGVPALQDDGLIFLWVTGRAMELGRECLKLWGYERVDELIWVKTNQLQRIIRTGRTGHWLNHGKEHCLVGLKGNPTNLNRGLDCDVIVAEVRATSHKPDEIYGIIERLSPGTRKIELFGRPHNVQPNWITLGNQLDGIRLVDPELVSQFEKRYPDGNCMAPTSKNIP
ncbi:N6-adenosine-methyltransferase MT-A70-like protein [Lutzomyia longipalpis]|uniref:N6-adenosine-methyltransferase MT-A70-like protein n=1 Tax=Lutzomyia longipalpis TaxID=7200 RepID=UPI002484458B|nr:N6-adenosine-methyltransferase MT-A70-like protein [Lutzomyia longipalpis]